MTAFEFNKSDNGSQDKNGEKDIIHSDAGLDEIEAIEGKQGRC